MLISDIQETDVLAWLEKADDAPKIIIRVWNYAEGLDD